jgi:nitrogen PTS system EIIA component
MQLLDVLLPNTTFIDVKSTSKKHLLQLMAHQAAGILGVEDRRIFEALVERERLGSTGIGHGVAIPHARFEDIKNLTVFFAQLSDPIDFEAIDNKPVDLVFMLIAPHDAGAEHLKMLARISRLVRDSDVREQLRGVNDPEAVQAIISSYRSDHQAA